LPPHAAPLTRVFALVSGFRAFASLEPHRFGLLAVTLAEPRVLITDQTDAEPVARAMTAALQPLAAALGAAVEAALLDDGDVAERTVCLFAMLHGLLQLQKEARHAPGILDIDRLMVRGTRSLLIGWGARARTVDASVARVGTGGFR
jgi:hypothetical protein